MHGQTIMTRTWLGGGGGGGGALKLGQQEMGTALAVILKTGDRTKNLTVSAMIFFSHSSTGMEGIVCLFVCLFVWGGGGGEYGKWVVGLLQTVSEQKWNLQYVYFIVTAHKLLYIICNCKTTIYVDQVQLHKGNPFQLLLISIFPLQY